jgi:hypothetical protein
MSRPLLESSQFKLGKYDVVAKPLPYATHMLRYTIYVGKKRIGSMVSRPCESDCKFLENPPIVPPLKIFYVTSKPGRPKAGARPPVPVEKETGPRREELPSDVPINVGRDSDR